MREQKTITLGENKVTVYEMTPKEVIFVLPILKELLKRDLTEEELINLLIEKYDNIKEVLVNCTSLKEEILDVGLSYLMPVLRAFVEVNRAFFEEAKRQLVGER